MDNILTTIPRSIDTGYGRRTAVRQEHVDKTAPCRDNGKHHQKPERTTTPPITGIRLRK